MTGEIDDPIDVLLRDQFDGPVTDQGFTDRVLAGLPARRRAATWPVAAGTVLGAMVCGYSLSQSPLVGAGWQDWMAGHWSVEAVALMLAMMVLPVMLLLWTLAEAGGRGSLHALRTV